MSLAARIRLARPADEHAADALVKSIFPADAHTYAQCVRFPEPYICAIAEAEDGATLGFSNLLIHATPGEGTAEWRRYPLYVGVIAVREDARGSGIGTKILDLLIRNARIRARNYDHIHLHTRAHNVKGLGFFRKYGFEEVHRLPPDRNGEIGILMRKYIGDIDV